MRRDILSIFTHRWKYATYIDKLRYIAIVCASLFVLSFVLNIYTLKSSSDLKTHVELLALENAQLKTALTELNASYARALLEKEELVTEIENKSLLEQTKETLASMLEQKVDKIVELTAQIDTLKAEKERLEAANEFWFGYIFDALGSTLDEKIHEDVREVIRKSESTDILKVVIKVDNTDKFTLLSNFVEGMCEDCEVIERYSTIRSARANVTAKGVLDLAVKNYVLKIYFPVEIDLDVAAKLSDSLKEKIENSMATQQLNLVIIPEEWPTSAQLDALEDEYNFVIVSERQDLNAIFAYAPAGNIPEAATLTWIEMMDSA